MEEEEQIKQGDDEFEDEETSRDLVVPGETVSEDVQNFSPGRGTMLAKDRSRIISLHIGLKQIKKRPFRLNLPNISTILGFSFYLQNKKTIVLNDRKRDNIT